MTTDTPAAVAPAVAEAVAETAVAAQVAKGEAVAAVGAAGEAEGAAADAKRDAETVKEMADREVANAQLDAEARIAAFKTEIETCRTEIAGLRASMEATAAAHQSVLTELATLAWLKELSPETLKKEGASETSSETDGNTSGGDDGKTLKQEPSKDESKAKDVQDGHEKPKSVEKKDEKPLGRRKHNWL